MLYLPIGTNTPTRIQGIFITDDDEKEMEEFRQELVQKIKDTELNQKVFSSWLWKFDNKREWVCN